MKRSLLALLMTALIAPQSGLASETDLEDIRRRLTQLEQVSQKSDSSNDESEFPKHSYIPYASLRLGVGTNTPDWDVGDVGSRVGIIGRSEISDYLAVIGRLEFGVNTAQAASSELILDSVNNRVIDNDTDEYLRLGWAGLDTKFGVFTVGKSWSAYYDVTGATDVFWVFGGEGSGTFNIGDGGGSGTGRAEKAVIYRHSFGPFNFAAQYQPRATMYIISNSAIDPSPEYAGSFGLTGRWNITDQWEVGVAYNRSNVHSSKHDGGIGDPDDPTSLAALYDISGDDEATAANLIFRSDELSSTYLAVVGGIYQEHLVAPVARRSDGTNLRKAVMSGKGWEIYAHHNITPNWRMFGGMNYTRPQRHEEDAGNVAKGSEFEVFMYGAAYNLLSNFSSALYLELQRDNSKGDYAPTDPQNRNIITFGIYYSMGL